MVGRREFLIGGGLLGVGITFYGGYRIRRWRQGRSPRVFDRNIFQINEQEMTGNVMNGAHVLIPDHATAEDVIVIDSDIENVIRRTDFEDQYLVGVLAGAQSSAELSVDSIETLLDGISIALSFSYPRGVHEDDFVYQSALIRVDGEELPAQVETNVSGRR